MLAPCRRPVRQPRDGRRSYGHSLVLDPWGRVVLDLGEAPAVGLTTLTESALSRARDALPALTHRRPLVLYLAKNPTKRV